MAADTVLATSPREALRWGACFVVVAGVHVGAAVALLQAPGADDGFTAGAAVMMVDLPDAPAATPVPDRNMAPGPDVQQEAAEAPDRREETKPPEETAEVELPDPEPPRPTPPAEEIHTAPPPVTAVAVAPPTAGVDLPQPPSKMVKRWQSGLSAQIARNKRYPQKARVRHEEGRVIVAFTIDRDGKLVDNRVLRSSGSDDLDQEALSSVVRAQPLPKPPADAKDIDLTFTVPFDFARPPTGW